MGSKNQEANTGGSQPQVFSVRIVSIDYYMGPPIPGLGISYSPFHGGKVNEVPVIRVYGSTPAGQKTCLHIHGVLPYLYIPCSDLGPMADDEVDAHKHSISLSLEKTLRLKGNAGSKRQHVHGCDIVRARKFYGYHSSEELFVKIYLYYPHDVSRAADILLTGAILDKILQPYESHIPFLLQFLIDNHLYGMGHLHVSKVRFRSPVPDVFSHRKVKDQGKVRPLADDSTCMGFQVDLGGDLCLNTPIWISSTVPDGWIWQYSPLPDSSTNENIPLFRRQSTSELEVDAAVHDIINQQFVSYASLSQTHSEVKMVQSLIPIWEEEYERNGVPEAIPPDSEKPLPQDVLKILSDGIDFENFMEARTEAGNWSLLTPQSTESSKVCGDLIDSEFANVENNNDLPSKYLKASDRIGSLLSSDTPFRNDAAETNDIDAADQLQISSIIGPSTAKVTDEDGLRLLKWLASSQAAEDINSDDELARETILSPLQPSKDIDKVLEIANVGYESESQKECQDILDTIDMLNFEESNDRAFPLAEHNHSNKFLSSKIIPQVDGSSDDLQSTPCQDKLLKTGESEAKPFAESQPWPELDSNLIGKNRLKRPRWGSLPVSHQKVSDVLPPDTHCISNGHDDEGKEGSGTSWLGDESKRFSVEKKDVSYMEQDSIKVDCSTRDLMRRKRSHRNEFSECRSQVEDWKAESDSEAECCKGDVNPDFKLCNDIEVCNEAVHIKPTMSSSEESAEAGNLPKNGNPEYAVQVDCGDSCCDCVKYDSNLHVSSCKLEPACISKTTIIGEDFPSRMLQTGVEGSHTALSKSVPSDLVSNTNCISESGYQTSIPKCQLPDIPADDYLKGVAGESTIVRLEKSPENVNDESETVKLIAMTFSVKPPIIDWRDEPEREALKNGGSNVVTSLQGDIADNCLPFFVRNCPEEEEELQGVSIRKCKYIGKQGQVMGVPTLCPKDGSYLFMLTPAVSPPLKESVDRWISCDSSDILRQKINVPSPLLPLSVGSPGDMVDSQGSQADEGNFPLPESASLSEEKPNQMNCSMEVKALYETKKKISTACSVDTSQLSGPDKNMRPTPLSQTGFRDPASAGQGQQLTLMSIEVQAESRGDLRPDPRFDAINIIVLVLQEDDESTLDTHVLLRCGSVYVEKDLDAVPESRVFVFTEELQLLEHFTKVVHASDPDVLMGWDVQSGSLGFLAERAAHVGVGLLNNISRTPSHINAATGDSGASEKLIGKVLPEPGNVEAVHLEKTVIEDEWGRTHASGVHVGGRIVLNIWRLMRNEVKLNMYTVEAVAETILRRKIPYIPWKVLTKWFSSGPGRARYRSIDYTLKRAKLNLQVMNQLDMINRTSELARVFGIDFFSVLSRGSQYRVESMYLRLAHTQNYIAISPGKQQVANQPAMECLPLVMEPESNFYADPVIVLDFQSLYPSMVIAYNLCFCTCLGKITPPKANTLGVSSYSPDVNILCNLKRELLVTPNGVVYVPSIFRKGILPRLLEEILSTRIMVKQAMKKLGPSQRVLHRVLNARQLALKLIANVTYGYTAAGFSGRMPCAELADSIVQCGRRTLEAAISFVNSNDKWKARVIYGDTDSMFVLLKGRSLKEAFTVGQEIASAITEMNPSPVTLKMEKVYFPCFLLTKKRYVGYSYESPDQSKPIFDAKGIETVRRDTCIAVSKTMEQSLRIYFESRGIDKVKEYMLRQWTRILSGRISLQDFVFAKEVRLGTYTAGACSLPPAAIVATKSLRTDPRAEPRYAERIPYVVVHGEPGARLVDMVVDPLELLAINSPFRLNDIYYIRKQIIPALQRVFGLVGADLNQWFLDMPRPARKAIGKRHSFVPNPPRMRIDYYYESKHCILCGDLVQGSVHLCHNCSEDEITVATTLTRKTSKLEKDMQHLAAICRHCGGGDWLIENGVKCISLACSVFYERIKVQKELMSLSEVASRTGFYPTCN
ncbi:DNA polymerase zeta catalytic subunit [Phtheirospermum japonicum]|uniref:DNA polymerase n=1 Tax=Phtheirospermum japonicum TaxID=374723 RepID=A0A830C3W0_9LAMI|nr:DNA polymerase zeta catalytic subunit [Phtheirospermum japonicum]